MSPSGMQNNVRKIATIVGARPQFIKAAVVSRAIQSYNTERAGKPPLVGLLIHTGQHYDREMSATFFKELSIPEPDYNLEVGSGSQGRQTGMMLERIENVLLKEMPQMVIVYGDTNSTLAGALAASKLHIPVAHVEAGLRSYNKKMPEEINRILVDHLSELLFCPTKSSVKNLGKEGISRHVYEVGDVMYDSLLFNVKLAAERSDILDKLILYYGNGSVLPYYLATVHRAENTDNLHRLQNIFKALQELDTIVVFPVHPRTKNIDAFNEWKKNVKAHVKIINPVSYLDMLVLEKHARAILTDSGGVQKEAYMLKVPCITLRDETEWVETIESGWNTLAGADTKNILAALKGLDSMDTKRVYDESLYGSGNAGKKIVEIVSGWTSCA